MKCSECKFFDGTVCTVPDLYVDVMTGDEVCKFDVAAVKVENKA
jgi:hypothetical protein